MGTNLTPQPVGKKAKRVVGGDKGKTKVSGKQVADDDSDEEYQNDTVGF